MRNNRDNDAVIMAAATFSNKMQTLYSLSFSLQLFFCLVVLVCDDGDGGGSSGGEIYTICEKVSFNRTFFVFL